MCDIYTLRRSAGDLLTTVFITSEYTCTIQVKFFRYFRFYNDGSCLYALNNVPPRDMLAMLQAEKVIAKKVRAHLPRTHFPLLTTTIYPLDSVHCTTLHHSTILQVQL